MGFFLKNDGRGNEGWGRTRGGGGGVVSNPDKRCFLDGEGGHGVEEIERPRDRLRNDNPGGEGGWKEGDDMDQREREISNLVSCFSSMFSNFFLGSVLFF